MRTTLDIETDVLLAAKELARHRHESVGKVMSELARQALTQRPVFKTRHGIPQIPVRPDGGPVTLELVNKLRDEYP
jgi:hypothetical protein